MKNVLIPICIMMLAIGSRGQTNDLVIKNGKKGLYVDHKVTPKENFYSMGRLFNVHPKHIASFNSLDMTKGLSLGQMVQIPLTDTNFNQKTEKGQPVYYVAGNNENLHRVSTNNNNVLIENLRQWNNLFSDNITSGSKLIVGFLVTKDAAATAIATTSQQQTTDKVSKDNNIETTKGETSDKSEVKKENVKQQKEEAKKDEVKTVEPKKEESKKDEVKTVEPKKEESKKEEPQREEVRRVKQETKAQGLNQGYFKTSFDQQIRQHPTTKEQTFTAGIFKTASGWSDAKYYLLMDGVDPGTIVRITNPANNKMIYAKLLGEMSGLKQNQGINIRISNAAASALDIAETDKFVVKLNY